MKTLNISSLEELDDVAKALVESLAGRNVVALYGQMGAGKTTLISALMKRLGSSDIVSSPTFALVNQYISGEGDEIYHFDFYRINSLTEALDMGYEEYFDSGNLCLVEWPEKIEALLPDDIVRVTISVDGPEERTFTIE